MNCSTMLLFISLTVLGACSSTAKNGKAEAGTVETGASSFDRLFPMPTEPLRIPGETDRVGNPYATLEELLVEMERITPARFLVGQEVRMILSRTTTGNLQSILVPPARVWTVFEALLCERDFILEFVSTEEPLMLSVNSTQPMAGRGSLSTSLGTVKVEVADLPRWKAHPAFFITTTVELNSLNVRDLSNSMRQLLSNPQTMQIVPIGNSNSLMISGTAVSVVNVTDLLLDLNESARVRHEKEDKLTQEERDKAASRTGVSARK